ncbi:MAG: DUF1275 domain-containing protein [Clostridiales bacterium]|jgi:uncharacterized membrane protein YoaK (UPF0700 family)|nr:DUF1275 domain-containing protein [Clostridiales bacterium]
MKINKKFREVVPKHFNTHESLRLGIILAAVGGFLESYTFIGRGGVFANAESGNIVLVAIGLAKKDYKISALALIQIIAFILGTLVNESIRQREEEKGIDPNRYSKIILIIEALILFIVGLIPETAPNSLVTSIIAFISAMQMSAFKTLVDSPYSTTICTGNLRTASESFLKAIRYKDEVNRTRTIRYFIIIIFFAMGAALGGILTKELGVKSIFAASGLLLLALVIFYYDNFKCKYESDVY